MSTPWHERWNEGRTGFHKEGVHPQLVAWAEAFLGDEPRRVLVPLAGKTHDIPWLIARGHEVVAVELVDVAVQAFHAEQQRVSRQEPSGAFQAWRSAGLSYLQGDVLDLRADHLQGVDRVWDRAAMVALPEEVRRGYVARLRALLPSGSRVLLSHFSYDQEQYDGPPFSVSSEEVEELYAGATIEHLETVDEIDISPKFRELGLDTFMVHLKLITLD